MVTPEQVQSYIEKGLKDSEVRVVGDGEHFEALIVSEAFRGKSRVQRHQLDNAALPLMCAGLLTSEQLTLSNVPHLRDVSTMLRLLAQMGVEVSLDDRLGLSLRAERLSDPLAPYDLVKTMRASILVLGPLLARCGEARVSLPGGCAIGTRPVDLHVKGLTAPGAEISVEQGYISAKAKRLKAARILMDLVTVTGTENLMMAACLAEGTTTLEDRKSTRLN